MIVFYAWSQANIGLTGRIPPSEMATDIRIGTSGFHYKHWCGPFYPEKLPSSKMLGHYLEHFDTVELNNSF